MSPLPLLAFRSNGYGLRQGLPKIPSRFAQALAPWAFGLALADWVARSLLLTAAPGVLSLGLSGHC